MLPSRLRGELPPCKGAKGSRMEQKHGSSSAVNEELQPPPIFFPPSSEETAARREFRRGYAGTPVQAGPGPGKVIVAAEENEDIEDEDVSRREGGALSSLAKRSHGPSFVRKLVPLLLRGSSALVAAALLNAATTGDGSAVLSGIVAHASSTASGLAGAAGKAGRLTACASGAALRANSMAALRTAGRLAGAAANGIDAAVAGSRQRKVIEHRKRSDAAAAQRAADEATLLREAQRALGGGSRTTTAPSALQHSGAPSALGGHASTSVVELRWTPHVTLGRG